MRVVRRPPSPVGRRTARIRRLRLVGGFAPGAELPLASFGFFFGCLRLEDDALNNPLLRRMSKDLAKDGHWLLLAGLGVCRTGR